MSRYRRDRSLDYRRWSIWVGAPWPEPLYIAYNAQDELDGPSYRELKSRIDTFERQRHVLSPHNPAPDDNGDPGRGSG